MSAALSSRGLIIPAPRVDSRETLVTTMPFFLRASGTPPVVLPPPSVPPMPLHVPLVKLPLLSFDGASFMDDFLALAANPPTQPALLAWRDWAEPPTAMLDVSGAKLYSPSIVRAAPLHVEPEQEPAGTLDPDGVPHGDPAWLRKLYLPLHLRFCFVAFDVVCRRSFWPKLDRARVVAAGAVVRRLVRDPAAERWEDWLSADGKTGLWFELHGGLPADPAVIPSGAYRDTANVPQDAAIAARLGLPAPTVPAPLTLQLDSAKLTLLPPTIGDSAAHCSLYGLLPVHSAAQQTGDDTPGFSDAAIAQAFHDHALAALGAAWADDAGLRTKLGPDTQVLLDRTILPTATGDPGVARGAIAAAAGVSSGAVIAALPAVVWTALVQCGLTLKPGPSNAEVAETVDAFWTGSGAAQAAVTTTTLPAGMNPTRNAQAGNWNILVVEFLRNTARTMLATAGAPDPSGDADVARALLAIALIRLRRLRLALLHTLHTQMFGNNTADQQADKAALTAIQTQTIGGTAYNIPSGTAGGSASEIEAALAMDAIRTPPEDAPPWPPFSFSAADRLALAGHQAGLALERLLEPIDAAGSDGGSAYEAQVHTSTTTTAGALAGNFNDPTHSLKLWSAAGDPLYRLVEAGLDLREQPSRGMLVFPGPAPQHATFMTMTNTVANAYTAGGAVTRAEAKGRARVHRLRYDHNSLYAVWGWVRVAGRNDCENEQIVWTDRSEPFAIAEPTDILGAKPVTIQLPDLPKLIRDIPRIAKARAKPFAAFNTPANSGFNVGDDPKKTTRAWGVGWICSFGIPVFTICAFILFSIIFSILILIPGFAWMLLLKFCIPIPVPKKS